LGVGAYALQASISLPETFTFEFVSSCGDPAPGFWLQFQNNRFYSNKWSNQFQFMRGDAGTQSYTTWMQAGLYGNDAHFAFCRTGTTLSVYVNGAFWTSFTETGTGVSFAFVVAVGCNVRAVAKNLGNGSSFPVPFALYTGYEAL
jgi:hypothetical protein